MKALPFNRNFLSL